MMLLSRFWYAVLAILAALAAAVVILAVGQYNRRAQVAMTEELAGDTQVVKWAMQIDARHRLDALLIGALEKGVQDGCVAANGQDKVPAKAKEEARAEKARKEKDVNDWKKHFHHDRRDGGGASGASAILVDGAR